MNKRTSHDPANAAYHAVMKLAKAQSLTKKGGQDDMRLILTSLIDGLKINVQRQQMAQDAMQAQQEAAQPPQGGQGR